MRIKQKMCSRINCITIKLKTNQEFMWSLCDWRDCREVVWIAPWLWHVDRHAGVKHNILTQTSLDGVCFDSRLRYTAVDIVICRWFTSALHLGQPKMTTVWFVKVKAVFDFSHWCRVENSLTAWFMLTGTQWNVTKFQWQPSCVVVALITYVGKRSPGIFQSTEGKSHARQFSRCFRWWFVSMQSACSARHLWAEFNTAHLRHDTGKHWLWLWSRLDTHTTV